MTEIDIKSMIKVIKVAKKLGVTRLKLGTLEFELHTNEITPRPRPALKVSKQKIAQQADKHQMQMQIDDASDQLSTLHVEDPQAFEQAMVDKELEDAGDTIEETYDL